MFLFHSTLYVHCKNPEYNLVKHCMLAKSELLSWILQKQGVKSFFDRETKRIQYFEDRAAMRQTQRSLEQNKKNQVSLQILLLLKPSVDCMFFDIWECLPCNGIERFLYNR